jgi:hypothetical protein
MPCHWAEPSTWVGIALIPPAVTLLDDPLMLMPAIEAVACVACIEPPPVVSLIPEPALWPTGTVVTVVLCEPQPANARHATAPSVTPPARRLLDIDCSFTAD